MAKAKNTARTESPRISTDTLRKLDELSVGISIVRGTAKCVERALWNQVNREDQELSILVREYLVKELNRLHQQTKAIMIAIEGRLPYPDEET